MNSMNFYQDFLWFKIISSNIPPLRDFVNRFVVDDLSVAAVRQMAWAMGNMCRGHPQPAYYVISHVGNSRSK